MFPSSVLLAIALAFVGVVADSFIKKASLAPSSFLSGWFVLGAAMYAATAFGWVYVMKSVKLETIGIYYSLSTVILLVLAGTFFFGERMTTPEWVGVCLGIISILLLGRFS
jgi:small multidrug resistance pump